MVLCEFLLTSANNHDMLILQCMVRVINLCPVIACLDRGARAYSDLINYFLRNLVHYR